MSEQEAIDRAHEDAREGKSPTTQAGEFVREVIDQVRDGKLGVTSAKQAIAIGLSKARRAGVKLLARKKRKSTSTRKKAKQAKGGKRRRKPSRTRSTTASARKTVRTKGASGRSAAARKTARKTTRKAARHRT